MSIDIGKNIINLKKLHEQCPSYKDWLTIEDAIKALEQQQAEIKQLKRDEASYLRVIEKNSKSRN